MSGLGRRLGSGLKDICFVLLSPFIRRTHFYGQWLNSGSEYPLSINADHPRAVARAASDAESVSGMLPNSPVSRDTHNPDAREERCFESLNGEGAQFDSEYAINNSYMQPSAPVDESNACLISLLREEVAEAQLALASRLLPGSPDEVEAQTYPDRQLYPGFDGEFYLEQYPDIKEAGVDPYTHYVVSGINEGRLGVRPVLPLQDGYVTFDPSKETIMVISHEASRTGAPILSLNLVQRLQEQFNIVTVLLGGGPLVEAFRSASVLVAGPINVRNNSTTSKIVTRKLTGLYTFKFAIVNSIESSWMLEPLARDFVPTVSLIHEFACYTRPEGLVIKAIFWATKTVFSTKLTRDDALGASPELKIDIIPQGRSILMEPCDAGLEAVEVERIRTALRPPGAADDLVVVVGAGFVHIRKGVDLFIDCAAKVLRDAAGGRCRFVWIGRGYDPEQDLGYSMYLDQQIKRSGLKGRVVFIDETSCIEEVYRTADVLLISSRLDPLPNVAIDAMAHGLPVICFEGATGVAEVLSAHGLGPACVVGHLNTTEMAERLLALVKCPELMRRTRETVREIAAQVFDMDEYVAKIKVLAGAACEDVKRERRDAREIIDSSLIRKDFLVANWDEAIPLEQAVAWRYVRPWAASLWRRKPMPGFHPGIYRDAFSMNTSDGDPFAAYLRSGRPNGPWINQPITPSDRILSIADGTRSALHIHVFYPEILTEILQRLSSNITRPDLFISVPSAAVSREVAAALGDYSGKVVALKLVPNRGRDIGPFITAFSSDMVDNYDFVGHVHTKKTADHHAEIGEQWRHFLYENLIGGRAPMLDIILGKMEAEPRVGLVFPDDPNVVGWDDNKMFAESYADRLGLESIPDELFFPVGTMFWARSTALQSLFDLGLTWEDYPPEPLPYDGSVLHALERLLPLIVGRSGFQSVVTNVPGVTR